MKGYKPMDNYTYTFQSIVKALICQLCFAPTKSKMVNPNVISSGSSNAEWEDKIISWVDAEKLVNQIHDPEKQYIIYATANGFTEEEISQDLCLTQMKINRLKGKISYLIRRLQCQ